MDIRSAIKSQYHAALKTLREAIEKCPEALWNKTADNAAPFWRVVYHTLFFTHYYLQRDHLSLVPWVRAQEEAQLLGGVPWDNFRAPKPCKPYTRSELLEYWEICDAMIDGGVDALDLAAPECGFPWYKMPKLEHQIANIRHIQHHAAVLSHRLRERVGIGIEWVGGGREE